MRAVAVLPVVEEKKLEPLAPAKRPVNAVGLGGVAPERPVIEERLLPDRRQRVAGIVIIMDLVIVPDDVEARLGKQPLARRVVPVAAILGPKLGRGGGGAAAVGVDRVAQVDKEIRPGGADRVHDVEGLVAFPRVAAEAKLHGQKGVRRRRGFEARDRAGLLPGDGGAVIVGRGGLEPAEQEPGGVVGPPRHLDRRGDRGGREPRLFAVFDRDPAPRRGAEPNHRPVRRRVAGQGPEREARVGFEARRQERAARRSERERNDEAGLAG